MPKTGVADCFHNCIVSTYAAGCCCLCHYCLCHHCHCHSVTIVTAMDCGAAVDDVSNALRPLMGQNGLQSSIVITLCHTALVCLTLCSKQMQVRDASYVRRWVCRCEKWPEAVTFLKLIQCNKTHLIELDFAGQQPHAWQVHLQHWGIIIIVITYRRSS